MKNQLTFLLIAIFTAYLIMNSTLAPSQNSNPHQPEPYVTLENPEWTKNAVIYQINTRQFSEEGTFEAVMKELPRIKDLGADILWLMPIHKIGEKNRKGTLGSPYSVKDYYSVNPEFGTLDDFKVFVERAHELGMYVIIDWVANHTAWDNYLTEKHPDWYERDWKGDFRPTPWWDWTDIIDLDFSVPEVREYMTEAIKYWVEEVGVDGFRADVAGFVPVDFWNNLRKELEEIKPVFMLAEWESRDLHAKAFDATYAWSWYDAMHDIAMGRADLNALFKYYSWRESAYPAEAMRMTFTSNHDKNSWNGTMFDQFGDAVEAAIALSVVGDGIPLIYNGQEAGNEKMLEFFEKDPIVWREHPIGELYKKLFALKKAKTTLWNGKWGALMVKVPNSERLEVLSFVRENDDDKVFAVFNFSDKQHSVTFKESLHHGEYTEYFKNEKAEFNDESVLNIEPWGFRVFVK